MTEPYFTGYWHGRERQMRLAAYQAQHGPIRARLLDAATALATGLLLGSAGLLWMLS